MQDLEESRLRGIVTTEPLAMRVAVGRLLGIGMVAKAGQRVPVDLFPE
jgi:hypothetical protein